MQQIAHIEGGERNYTWIKGDTGPLVYPAIHVYIFWALYHITGKGEDIAIAQNIFGLLYLATIAMTMACYHKSKVQTALSFDTI
jgi:alpha-1,3-mannosyltransferase